MVTPSAVLAQFLVCLEAFPGQHGPEGWEEACDPHSRAPVLGLDRIGVVSVLIRLSSRMCKDV